MWSRELVVVAGKYCVTFRRAVAIGLLLLLVWGCGSDVPTTTSKPSASAWARNPDGFSSRLGDFALKVNAGGRLQLQPAAATAPSAALGLATSAIGREGWSERLECSLRGREQTLELVRSHSVETLVLGASAAEQSWTFQAAPAGEGDLVVKVGVEGGRFVGGDRRGLVFAANGFGIRYGRATWLDAAGQRQTLVSHYEAGEIAITVPADLIARSQFPATLDPVISFEQEIDGAAFSGARGATLLAASYCGGQYLAAWYEDDGRVFATRVAENGTVLDAGGVQLARASDDVAYDLHVACVDNVFGVLWRRYATNLQKPTAVEFVRVSAGGALLDAPPKQLSVASSYTLGANDSQFIYWWGGGGKIRATRISPDGPILDDVPIDVATSSPGEMFALSAGQSSYVFWDNGSQYMAGLEADGTVTTPAAGSYLFGGSYTYLAGVAFDGQSFLAAYTKVGGIGSSIAEVHAYRFDAAGEVLTPSFTIDADPSKQYALAVSAANQGFLVGHSRGEGYTLDPSYLAPVAADAQSVGAPIDLQHGGLGALVRGSTSQLAVYYGGTAQMLASSGEPSGEPFRLATARAAQEVPHMAALADQYLVAWASNGIRPVSANRLSVSGAVLDPTAIAFPPELAFSYYPHVASDGSEYVVAYHESVGYGTPASNVRLQRVSAAGKLVGSVKVVGTSAEVNGHDLAFDGQGYVVVWKTQDGAIHRSRYLKSSDTFEPAVELSASGDQADVGANSAGELAVWTESGRLRGRFAYRDATPPKTQFLTAVGSVVGEPEVASDGSGYLVVWRSGGSLSAQRWAANGTAIDASPIVISSVFASYQAPAATYDGARYLVVWAGSSGQNYDVRLSEISGKGLQQGFTLYQGVWPSDDTVAPMVAIASQGSERSLAAYSVRLIDPPFDSNRIRARFLDYSGAKVCATGAECASGFCVDGVCCDEACGNGNPLDCQACSVAAGAAKNGKCGPAVASTVCRFSAGDCDPQETCDGVALTCPADGRASATAVCRPSAGGCDAPEFCDGGVGCPRDGYAASTVACRASRGACDPVELCTGESRLCPVDSKLASGEVCRAAVGACDVAEVCDGAAAACPSDALALAGTVCRPAAGTCDVAEQCAGAAACPSDQLQPACGEGGAGGTPEVGGSGGMDATGGMDAAGGVDQTGGHATDGGSNSTGGIAAAAGVGGSEAGGQVGGAPAFAAQSGAAGDENEPGTSGGAAGGAPDDSVTSADPKTSNGCSCRVPAPNKNEPGSLLVLLPLMVLLRRRSRVSPASGLS